MGGEHAMEHYNVCIGPNLTCMNDLMNRMGQFDHVEYHGKMVKCRSACEDQINSLFVTTSSYPNRKTLVYREEFCIVAKRLVEKCNGPKRKPLEREYPQICSLLKPLENITFCTNNNWDIRRHLIPNCDSRKCPIEDVILDYAKENLVMFNIFIKDPYAKRFQKDEKITKTSYIANSGGLLGLCMGFSLISGAEILFHFVFGIFSAVFPAGKKTANAAGSNGSSNSGGGAKNSSPSGSASKKVKQSAAIMYGIEGDMVMNSYEVTEEGRGEDEEDEEEEEEFENQCCEHNYPCAAEEEEEESHCCQNCHFCCCQSQRLNGSALVHHHHHLQQQHPQQVVVNTASAAAVAGYSSPPPFSNALTTESSSDASALMLPTTANSSNNPQNTGSSSRLPAPPPPPAAVAGAASTGGMRPPPPPVPSHPVHVLHHHHCAMSNFHHNNIGGGVGSRSDGGGGGGGGGGGVNKNAVCHTVLNGDTNKMCVGPERII